MDRSQEMSARRETPDEALDVVESYGPWGSDINDYLRRQIVLADEVKRLREEVARLTWTLEAAQAIWNKMEKGLREEIKSHDAWLSQAHVLCGDLGIPPGHIEDRLFAAIGRAGQLVGHAEAQRFVRLHETNDGVWAHFRVGNGYAYSVNLSADPMSRKFAIEYHNMAAGIEALLKGEPE